MEFPKRPSKVIEEVAHETRKGGGLRRGCPVALVCTRKAYIRQWVGPSHPTAPGLVNPLRGPRMGSWWLSLSPDTAHSELRTRAPVPADWHASGLGLPLLLSPCSAGRQAQPLTHSVPSSSAHLLPFPPPMRSTVAGAGDSHWSQIYFAFGG